MTVARTLGRVGLGLVLIVAGIAHFLVTESFLAQVPAGLPGPVVIVYVSGVVEIILGAALVLLPRWSRELGWVIAVFFVAIFPGNIYQAVEGIDAFGLDTPTARWVRLLFQPLLIVWALWSTGAWSLKDRPDGGEDTDALIRSALDEPFEGWDFGVFAGRYEESAPPWDFRELVRRLLGDTTSLLDMGTGGGELLAQFSPLPDRTVATEGFPPNVPVARARLEPLGVEVVEVEEGGALPLPGHAFDLTVNRHEEFDAAEVRRVLRPGGTFLTQQVGGRDLRELNEALGAPPSPYLDWDLTAAVDEIQAAGLHVVRADEAYPGARFHDIGAVVLFLRIAPWQIPDFSTERYRDALRELDGRIRRDGGLAVTCHRFLVIARCPA